MADFRTDGAIASPGSENMEPTEPTKARRRNYSSVKEIQDRDRPKTSRNHNFHEGVGANKTKEVSKMKSS